MLDVGIKETTTTTGTGTVTLSAETNFVRVSQAFSVGDPVSYCLVSGNGDKEWGIGKAGASNTLSRDFVEATLVGATFNNVNPTAISLTGTSTLSVVQHSDSNAGDVAIVSTPFGTQYLCPFASNAANLGTLALTADRLFAIPYLPSVCANAFTGIGMIVTTAVAGSAYIGVAESARDAGGGWRPGRLLGQSGAINVGTTGDKVDTGFFPNHKAGHIYWLLLTCSSAATVRSLPANGISCPLGFGTGGTGGRPYLQASVAGPLPSDLSAQAFTLGSQGSAAPFIYFST